MRAQREKEGCDVIVLVEWKDPFAPTWESLEDFSYDMSPEVAALLKEAESGGRKYVVLGEQDAGGVYCEEHETQKTNVLQSHRNYEGFPIEYLAKNGSCVQRWIDVLRENPTLRSTVLATASDSPRLTADASQDSGDADFVPNCNDGPVPMDLASPVKLFGGSALSQEAAMSLRNEVAPTESSITSSVSSTDGSRRPTKRALTFNDSNAAKPRVASAPQPESAARFAADLFDGLARLKFDIESASKKVFEIAATSVSTLLFDCGIPHGAFVLLLEKPILIRDSHQVLRSVEMADSTCSFSATTFLSCCKTVNGCNKFKKRKYGTLVWRCDETWSFINVDVANNIVGRAEEHFSRLCIRKDIPKTQTELQHIDQRPVTRLSTAGLGESGSRRQPLLFNRLAPASTADLFDSLQSGFIISELVSNAYTNERRVGPKSQPARAQSDIIKHASAISGSPFFKRWMLCGEQQLVDFRNTPMKMRKLLFDSNKCFTIANAPVLLERDALELAKTLLDHMVVVQRPLKRGEAQSQSLSPQSREDLATLGGNGKFEAGAVTVQAITVRLRAGKKQIVSAATLSSKGTSIVALFRFFLGFCSDESSSSHAVSLNVLSQVHRHVVLLVKAAQNQSEMLKEVGLVSNMPIIVNLALRLRHLFDVSSMRYFADLSWLLQDVSIGNDANNSPMVVGHSEDILAKKCEILFGTGRYAVQLVANMNLYSFIYKGVMRTQSYNNCVALRHGIDPEQQSLLYARMVCCMVYTDRLSMFGFMSMRDKTQTSKPTIREPIPYQVQVLAHLVYLHHWWLRRHFSVDEFPLVDAAKDSKMGPVLDAGLAIPLCVAVSQNNSRELQLFSNEELERCMMELICFEFPSDQWYVLDDAADIGWRRNINVPTLESQPVVFVLPSWLNSLGKMRAGSAVLHALMMFKNLALWKRVCPILRHSPDMRSSLHYAPSQPMLELQDTMEQLGKYVGFGDGSYPPAPGTVSCRVGLAKMALPVPLLTTAQMSVLDIASLVMFPHLSALEGQYHVHPLSVWQSVDNVLQASEYLRILASPIRIPFYLSLCGIPCLVTMDAPLCSSCTCCHTRLDIALSVPVSHALRYVSESEREGVYRFQLMGHKYERAVELYTLNGLSFHRGVKVLEQMQNVSFISCPNHERCGRINFRANCNCKENTYILIDDFIMASRITPDFVSDMDSKRL